MCIDGLDYSNCDAQVLNENNAKIAIRLELLLNLLHRHLCTHFGVLKTSVFFALARGTLGLSDTDTGL